LQPGRLISISLEVLTVTLPDLPVNLKIIGHPINWLVIASIAALWLMLFHSIATGYLLMNAGKDASNA
jgi:hypothetical protein